MHIKESFKSLIPPLSPEEFDQLEKNCLQEGIRDPLVVWNDILIDGHNRYRIAQKHGLEYETVERDFYSEDEAKAWIIENQLGRRNLTKYDRSLLALKLKPVISDRAKANQIASGGAVPQKSAKPIDTREELAKAANVSHDTIHKVEAIEEKGSDKLKEQARAGEISINKAYGIVMEKEKPKPKQPLQATRERIEEVKAKDIPSIQDIKRMKEDQKTVDLYDSLDLSQTIYSMLAKISKTIITVKTWAPEQIRLCTSGGANKNLISDIDESIVSLQEMRQILSGRR